MGLMTRTALDRRLSDLHAAVLLMGEGVAMTVSRALDALAQQDQAAASAVISEHERMERERAAIEAMCACLIALHQPVLRDLRAVLAALIIAGDLERIGDHASGIAQLVRRLQGPSDHQTMLALSGLACLAQGRLRGALEAYRAGDAGRARALLAQDVAALNLHCGRVQRLLAGMAGNRHMVGTATYLLWVVHHLERMAERSTTICERVIFMATGERGSAGQVAASYQATGV
jgi:phosphate transport system protein